ncbi:hypothetical protein [Noviluteimonas gilva]|uniref:Uncharacterized protein n=1 Tax=Noviluteimonas gilva TaxID=2682097 RepID=A0A7C9HUC6_9GAMM|nr:hypothetical protein [Lysobacter gilvus]MUV13558.1 hypothetical protein [Lysobacter gilvus]
MIEPYISDKQCTKCRECKPETEFPWRSDRPQNRRSVCKKCTQIWNCLYGRQRRSGSLVRRPAVKPTPLPAMNLLEQLDCIRFRKWARRVQPNPRFGVAMIGGGL